MKVTDAMRREGKNAFLTENVRDQSIEGKCQRIFEAMLDAAPPASLPEGWKDISTAPKTNAATMIAKPFLAWCPDETSTLRGDIRIVWWEPVTNGGCWWSDRDLEETPTHWMPLPSSPQPPER